MGWGVGQHIYVGQSMCACVAAQADGFVHDEEDEESPPSVGGRVWLSHTGAPGTWVENFDDGVDPTWGAAGIQQVDDTLVAAWYDPAPSPQQWNVRIAPINNASAWENGASTVLDVTTTGGTFSGTSACKNAGDVMLVRTSQNLYSIDAGGTVVDVTPPAGINIGMIDNFYADPVSGVWVVGDCDEDFVLDRVHVSDDHGFTWTTDVDPTEEGYLFGLLPVYDPVNEVWLRFTSAFPGSGDANGRFYRSYDSGVTWECPAAGIDSPGSSFTHPWAYGGRIFVFNIASTTDTYGWYTDDAGDNWTQFDTNMSSRFGDGAITPSVFLDCFGHLDTQSLYGLGLELFPGSGLYAVQQAGADGVTWAESFTVTTPEVDVVRNLGYGPTCWAL